MTYTKYEVKKFDETNNFDMCQYEIMNILFLKKNLKMTYEKEKLKNMWMLNGRK